MEMTQTKINVYRKAYSELNEIFNSALSFEIEKIPANVLENMRSQRDVEHNWSYDYSKNLMDQDMMDETKALLVEFYARYLCPEEERNEWKKYNDICVEVIEEERRKQTEQNNIFYKAEELESFNQIETAEIKTNYNEKTESSKENMLSENVENKTFFVKILEAFKNIFKK